MKRQSILLKTISKRIKILRKERGLSRVDLARLLKRDIDTIKRFESGKYNFRMRTIQRLAEVFDVEYKDLF